MARPFPSDSCVGISVRSSGIISLLGQGTDGTDSGMVVWPELRGLGYCARLSWLVGRLPHPPRSELSASWEDLHRVEFGWRPWVGFGLNLGVWTPFSSPGLSSWENHFFFYLAIKWAQPY